MQEQVEYARLVQKTLVVLGVTLFVALACAMIYIASNLLILVFGAILAAVAVHRLANLSNVIFRDKLSQGKRVAITLLCFAATTAGISFGFANSITLQVLNARERIQDSAQQLAEDLKQNTLVESALGADSLGADSLITDFLPSSTKSLGFAKTIFSSAFGGLTDCLILAILATYFSLSPRSYLDGIASLLPIAWRDQFSEITANSADTLWRWMLGRWLAMAVVGLLFGIGLAVLGIPMPIQLGVFAGIVTFIPNIGAVAAVIPALLLAANQGTPIMLGVVGLYLAIQFCESYVLTPLVQEQQVALPPAMIILAQVICGILFGLWGIAFATPFFAILQLWTKRLYIEGWIEKDTRSSGSVEPINK